MENAAARGQQLMQGLRQLQAQHPIMGDVRGKGLMVAVEFTHPDGQPAPEVAAEVLQHCLQQRLLLLACGTYKNVLRWIPPLVVSEAQVEEALGIFGTGLRTKLVTG